MGSKVNEQIRTYFYVGTTGHSNVAYTIYDEAGASFATGNMTEVGSTGMYYKAWTPDAAGVWVFRVLRGSAKGAFVYHVGMGQEADLDTALGSEFDGTPDVYDVLVTGYTNAVTASKTGSVLELAKEIIDGTKGTDAIYDLIGTNDTSLDSQLATIDGNVDSILIDTGTTLPATLEDIMQKATSPAWNQDTDSLEAIRAAIDANDTSVDSQLLAIDNFVDELESRLTATRAGYLDNINNANLSTIADISSLSATIIGYINNANLGTIADISSLTSTEIGYLNASISSRATAASLEDAMQKATTPAWNQDTDSLEAIREAIDTNDSSLDTQLSQIDGYVDLIDDATNGLAAIKAEVEGLAGAAMRGTDNALLAASYTTERGTDSAALASVLEDAMQKATTPAWNQDTDSLEAIRETIDTNDTSIDSQLATIDGYVDLIDDATNGLAAIKAEVEGLAGVAMRGTDNAFLAANYVTERGTDNALLAASYTAERGTDSAALASVLGALIDAAAQDGDATTSTAMSLIKGLHDVLWDADGIIAWEAAAAPGANISIAAVIRSIYDDTNELQSDDIPTSLSGIESKIDTIDGIVDNILIDTGTTLDGIVDAILVDTGTTLPATLSTMDGKIDTIDGIVDNILTDTSTTLDNLVDDLEAGLWGGGGIATWPASAAPGDTISMAEALRAVYDDTHMLQTDWVNGGRLDNLLDAIPTTAMRGTDSAATVADGWDAALATILDNFSAGRIGYLDELDFGLQEAIAALPQTMVGTNSAALASVVGALADAAAQDGDATTSTAMSLIKGLHDVLWDTDGIAVFPAAAAPANNVSMAEVLRAIYDDSNMLQTDWVDGGRLDLLLDAIPTTAMRGTDNAATEAKQDIIDGIVDNIVADTNELQISLADGGFTDLLIDAIKAKTDNLPVDPADASVIATAHGLLATEAKQDVIDGIVDNILADTNEVQLALADGGFTDSLIDSIISKIDTIDGIVDNILTDTGTTLDGIVDDILVDTGTTIPATLVTKANKNIFWSDYAEEVQLTSTAADTNLPSVTLPNITGTIVRVYGVFKFRSIENTNAAVNAVNVAQAIRIMKNGGAWGTDDVALIDIPDNLFGVAGETREGGDVMVGDNDVSSEVDALNQQYDIRWEDADVDQNNLNFNDVQVGLIVEWY